MKESSDGSETSDLESARKHMDRRCKLFYTIHQVLLLHQGPIHDFTLSMDAHHTCFEIDQIILHLSRNHAVKKLTFDFCYYDMYKPIFNGFVNLTNLSFTCGKISRKALLHLLSNCPSLKSLSLFILENDFIGSEYPSIMELFKCLPVIEDLTTTWVDTIAPLVKASVPQELPTSLIHLKYCSIEEILFNDGYGLTFVAVLIKCSPNLEKIVLEMGDDDEIESDVLEEYSVTLEKYSDVWLEHLKELEIRDFEYVEPVLELVKFILVRSPNLKKVKLGAEWVEKNEKLEMLKTLKCAPHASPVEIVVD
ncbi:putative FBD domain, leucine-rich repeat domain superfamily [Helianthus annuus]|nr:putative FBD domain, leucine-rich repeat domain superfamily [Helianthus annuus]